MAGYSVGIGVHGVTMRKLGCIGLIACLIAGAATAWEPAAPIDVDQVLVEAREAAMAGRFDDAAARHRWYHANALRHAPAHSGVRTSFAMLDWHRLALRHPPALDDMLAAQEAAARRVKAGGPEAREAIVDLAAFARVLGQPQAMATTFVWLDANRPADAGRFLLSALPALVSADESALVVRYLDVDDLLRRSASAFELLMAQQVAEEDPSDRRRRAQDFVDRQTAFAVAAMVRAGRPSEAEDLVKRLRAVLGDDAAMSASADALRGQAPPLYPY